MDIGYGFMTQKNRMKDLNPNLKFIAHFE